MADARFDPDRIFGDLRKELKLALVDATEGVRTEVIRVIRSSPASGRVYRRRGVMHHASAPGEPPASDTGFLIQSVQTSYDMDALVGTVNIGARYAPWLEYGTHKMEPRPFAGVALSNSRARIQARFEQAVNQATKKRSGK